jgi:hypothetical protein
VRFLILIVSFIPFHYFAQNSYVNRAGLQVGLNRMDIQFGINYTFDRFAIKPLASFDVGVNRTFFQNRFFPRFSIGAEYCLVKEKKIQFGPQFTYACSLLKVIKTSNHVNQFNEVYGGLYLCYGNRVQLKISVLTGWQNERFYSVYAKKKESANTVGFTMNCGVSYAF